MTGRPGSKTLKKPTETAEIRTRVANVLEKGKYGRQDCAQSLSPCCAKRKTKRERERGKGLETPLYGVIIHLDYFWREYYAAPLSAGGYPSPRKTHVLLHVPRHRRRPLIVLASKKFL